MAEPSPEQLKSGAAALEAALRGLTTPGRGHAGHQGLPGVMGPEFVKTMQEDFARQYKVETGLHPMLDEYLSGSGSTKEVPGLDIAAARRLQPVLQDVIAETLKHRRASLARTNIRGFPRVGMAEPSPDQLKMGAAALEAALRGLTTPGRGIAGHQGLPGPSAHAALAKCPAPS